MLPSRPSTDDKDIYSRRTRRDWLFNLMHSNYKEGRKPEIDYSLMRCAAGDTILRVKYVYKLEDRAI
jgi:hypothetical protein